MDLNDDLGWYGEDERQVLGHFVVDEVGLDIGHQFEGVVPYTRSRASRRRRRC